MAAARGVLAAGLGEALPLDLALARAWLLCVSEGVGRAP